LVLGLISIISCTKDSNTFGQNDYRAFSVCIEENNSSSYDSLIIGTVPNGKQWVVVGSDDDVFITISRYGNSRIIIKENDLNQIPFYIDEGNDVVLYGGYGTRYTNCISINEYNVD
jgi:hypothetical protein